MRGYSRLATLEEKRNLRRAFFFFVSTISLLLILVFLGIPTLVQIAAFLADLRLGTATISKKDTIAPVPPRLLAQPSATNSARIVITGTSESGSAVKIFLNGAETGEIISGNDEIFQKEIVLADGKNTILAIARDTSGNESQGSGSLVIIFDSQPPSLEISEPPEGASFIGEAQKKLTIKGKSEEGAKVTVNERLVIVDAQGNFQHLVLLSEGENTIQIVAIDQAANITEKLLRVNFAP